MKDFEGILEDVEKVFNKHRSEEGYSYHEMPLDALIGTFSEEIEEFWNECPDRLKGMYREALDIILVGLMVAEEVSRVLDMEGEDVGELWHK